jgi:hypothetical protein
MSDKDKLRAAMDALRNGGALPDGVTLVHASRETTQADWDALDPNSLETDCRACGAYYAIHWAENEPPAGTDGGKPIVCPHCGSGAHGGSGSPAGGFSVLMHDPRTWEM